MVSVANNHAMDFGGDALADTVRLLREARVLPVGGGKNLEEAAAAVELTRGGQRFLFLAISDILPAFSVADDRRPGVAPARREGFARAMRRALAAARKRADRVLVSVHWGKERQRSATLRQQQLGRQLIEWGADVVIGHHTHVLGTVEHYKRGIIHYSLGNFVGPLGKQANVGVWEVTFDPGKAPWEHSLTRRWDGGPLPPPRKRRR